MIVYHFRTRVRRNWVCWSHHSCGLDGGNVSALSRSPVPVGRRRTLHTRWWVWVGVRVRVVKVSLPWLRKHLWVSIHSHRGVRWYVVVRGDRNRSRDHIARHKGLRSWMCGSDDRRLAVYWQWRLGPLLWYERRRYGFCSGRKRQETSESSQLSLLRYSRL